MGTDTIIKVVTTADAGLLEGLNSRGHTVMLISRQDVETFSDGRIIDVEHSAQRGSPVQHEITLDAVSITRTYFGLDVTGRVVVA